MNAPECQDVEPKLYTVREMGRVIRRSPRWVYEHAHQLPGYTREFGGVLFLRKAVDAHLERLATGGGKVVGLSSKQK